MAAAVSSTNLASDPLGKESANSAIRTSNRQLASTAPGEHRQSQSNVAAEQSAAITRLNSAITEKKPGTSTTSKVGKSTMQSHDALATKIITEDLAWNLAEVKPLKDFCIQSIVQNFSVKPNLKKLPKKHRDYVFQSISLDLPLSLTATLIPDDGDGSTGGSIFWKRTCQFYFPKSKCDPRMHGNSWKSNFFELYIEEILNNFTPLRSNSNALLRSLRLARPFVQRLRASQVKPDRWTGPEGAEKIVSAIQTFRDQKLFSGIRYLISEIVDVNEQHGNNNGGDHGELVLESRSSKVSPLNHLDYSVILKELTQLKELELFYGVQECSMGFYWNLNGISVQDAKTLANSLKLALNLESLTIRGCRINDECCKIICAGILACKNLRKLNLSHNDIRDYGARAAATLIAQDDPLIRGPNITHLDLSDNKIGAEGIMAIGKALVFNSSLKSLNLSMNQLAEDETMSKMLSTFVSDNYTIEELQLGACGLGEKSVQVICDAIKHYATVNHRLLSGKDGQDKGLLGGDDDLANGQLGQSSMLSEGETDDDESVRSAAINKKKLAKRTSTVGNIGTGNKAGQQQAAAGKAATQAGGKKGAGAAPAGKAAATAAGKTAAGGKGAQATNKAGGANKNANKDGKSGQATAGASKSKAAVDQQATSDPNSEQSSVLSIAEESQRRRLNSNANKKEKDGIVSRGPQLIPPKYPCGWKRLNIASNPLINESVCGKLLFEAVHGNKWILQVDVRATQVGEHFTKSIMAVIEENREEQRKAEAEARNSATNNNNNTAVAAALPPKTPGTAPAK